jgi:hypothetical protein
MTRLTRVSTRIFKFGLPVCGYRYREAASERLPLNGSIYLLTVVVQLANSFSRFAERLPVTWLVEEYSKSTYRLN